MSSVDEWLNENGQYELGHPQVVINPVLTSPSKEAETLLEGCLSLPSLHVKVTRPKKIHISYQNLKQEIIEQELEGFRLAPNLTCMRTTISTAFSISIECAERPQSNRSISTETQRICVKKLGNCCNE